VFAACAVLPGSATAVSSIVFRGFGTATLDGAMSAGEWDSAAHADFTVNRAASEAGGTVPATMYVMNDAANLYLGMKVMNATIGYSRIDVQFGGRIQEGADRLQVDRVGNFVDRFSHEIAPNSWLTVRDIDYGGTTDGAEAEANAPGYSFYELSHPLNDADDAHDFSLRLLLRTSFNLRFNHCTTSCAASSLFPGPESSPQADIVVVSGSRVPPDTQITAAPRHLTSSPTEEFAFTATDDVLAAADLTFECKVGDDAWFACTSPSSFTVGDGNNTFAVRATDEMLNVDATPAEWRWTVDATGPSRPVIRGARSVRTGPLVLRFSARDNLTPAKRIRFRCALDSARLHHCAAVYRHKLRPGRHILGVKAVDSLLNEGETTKIRVTLKRRPR
jgi:hypothetical protein